MLARVWGLVLPAFSDALARTSIYKYISGMIQHLRSYTGTNRMAFCIALLKNHRHLKQKGNTNVPAVPLPLAHSIAPSLACHCSC